jgi:gliding motility-associated-like protein
MYRILLLLIYTLLIFPVKGQEVSHEHSVHHAFIENKGQWEDHVFFQNNVNGGNMWVEQGRVLFQLQDYSLLQAAHFSKKDIKQELTYREKLVQLEFVDALTVTEVEKKGATPHYYNYFLGNDESKWASEVRGYEEFTLKKIYHGVDVRFIEQEKQIKYEFIVAPQIQTDQIKLKYSYQDELKIDKNGNLIIKTELGDIIEEKPYAYQIVNGKINEIPCSYELIENVVTFKLGEYNKRVELIIDPTLVFATYCGAISDNFGMTATYGYDGSAYNGGTIYGNSHPMPDPSAYDVNSNLTVVDVNVVTTDAFITKYSPDGTTMLWATFFGGGDNTQGTDVPHSLICDKNDNIYVYGSTSSLDFPIVNGFQPNHAGGTPFAIIYNGTNFGNVGTDIYVAKFSANGHNLLGSTYVGGDKNDGVNYIISAGNYSTASAYDSLTMNYGDQFRGEIMLDSVNNILVGSCSRSDNFPTQNAFQPILAGQQDGVVFKLKNDFSGLEFSSFYGGSQADAIYSVKIDSSNNVVFGGGTTSLDLNLTASAFQNTYGGGVADGFIGKLPPDGLTLTHSTYIGAANYDQVFFIEIDRLDNIFILGQSNGGSFPVINAAYSNPNSSQFIAKFDPNLSTIVGSTVFGSGNNTFDISPSAFLVDICGNMYVSGWGGSVLAGSSPMVGMPVTPDAFQASAPNGFDFYLMVIEREFNSLLYASYLGGGSSREHVDGGTSRFDKNGVVYQGVCGGCGGNSDFPTSPGAWSNQNLANNCNALTFKFDFNLIPNAEFTTDNSIGCSPFEVNFNNFSSESDRYLWDFGNGDLDSTTFEPIITYTIPGTYNVMLTVTDSICLITDTAFITIEVYPEIDLENILDVSLCVPDTINLTADANGTATSFIWSSNSSFTDTLNTSLSDSTVQINFPVDGYYYVMAINNGCRVIDSVRVNFTSASLNLDGTNNLCLGDETAITATSNDPGIVFNNFDWSADSIVLSGDGSSSVTVQPSVTQYLVVTATANNGCVVTDSILVSVSDIDESSVIASASETSVPVGGEVTLSAEPSGYTYSWLPAFAVDDPNAQETTATVNESTSYTVSVSDGICTKTSSVWVPAFPYTCEEPFIFVPNAFTPNGDGENDVLYLRSLIVEDVIFRVYNRWGELVFETTTMHRGWDGTFRGKLSDPDVYDYYLEGHCIDGQEFLIKGNITLIR